MFNDYKKRLDDLGANTPKVFKYVAGRGAKHFVNKAKENTDRYKLVDTGNYRRNWWAENLVKGDVHVIKVGNDVEYASFIEDGYSIDRKHFVPFDQMQGTPKASKLISDFKSRYPNAKGFIAKPRRYKAMKIGRMALDETEAWTILELREEIRLMMIQKEYKVSRAEAKKYTS